ncbi:hypothetical protein HMI55_001405 [Coelomomyces lativittatus]|nr:hypothetical protein HMI55_001405 [Coelomomyces lativittatus]
MRLFHQTPQRYPSTVIPPVPGGQRGSQGQLNQIPQTYASAGNLPVPGGQFGTRGTQITNIVRSALNISGV